MYTNIGYNVDTVKQMRNLYVHLDREGDYWTEEERENLIQMYKDAVDITAIALYLRRSERAVVQQLQSMNAFPPTRTRVTKKKDDRCPGIDGCLCPTCSLYQKCDYRKSSTEDGGFNDA